MPFRLLSCVAVLSMLPLMASAQIHSVPTPPPTISAADRAWFVERQPILYAGDLYYPAGPRYHFNPGIMVPAGVHDGVPLYVDTSVQPYSEILVPVGGGLVQPYERRRAGPLAGTTGSHAPSFPVEGAPWEEEERSAAQWPAQPAPSRRDIEVEESVAGSRRGGQFDPQEEAARQQRLQPPGHVETILAPEGNLGIWILYEGHRWSISGPAVPFDAARFSRIGDYHGFPVYAARGSEEIFIPAANGMLAVYGKDARRGRS